MSVTVRLSKRLADVLGEEAATELTEYLNAVDLAYHTELRSLNEQNFTRLDTSLAQRLVEFRAELRHEMAEFKVEMRREMAEFKTEMRQEIADFKVEIRGDMAALRAEVHQEIRGLQGTLFRWMFGFWVMSTLTTVGLILTLWQAGGLAR